MDEERALELVDELKLLSGPSSDPNDSRDLGLFDGKVTPTSASTPTLAPTPTSTATRTQRWTGTLALTPTLDLIMPSRKLG